MKQSQAAESIQSGMVGRKAREEVNVMKQSQAAESIQSGMAGRKAREEVNAMKQSQAAESIQSGMAGRKARSEAKYALAVESIQAHKPLPLPMCVSLTYPQP